MSVSPDDLESYTITFRREIVFYLRQLVNDKDQVSVSFNEGADVLLTMLLHVDDENDLLYCDWGGSETANNRYLQSDRAFFIATPGGVRNQFLCVGRPQVGTYEGKPAFTVKLPEKYVRMQRREFFRLSLPMTQRPVCKVTIDGKTHDLSVVDIGIGGVAMETTNLQFPVEIGTDFTDALITIQGFGELRTPIGVRYVGDVAKGTLHVKRLGCVFTRLSAAQENLVQKFMAQIQREEKAKLG